MAAPEGFALVQEPVAQGLPHVVPLSATSRLLLVIPHGVITQWRDADPAAVVTRSDEELTPQAVPSAISRVPLKLLLQTGVKIAGAAPVVAGLPWFLPDGDSGVQYEVTVLSWDIRAGSLRGPGPYGSQISLAWRVADQAVDNYSTPPIGFQVAERLEPKSRIYSELGLRRYRQLDRFLVKKVVLR
jgi:hypothetical protein